MQIETMTMPVLSTGHLKEETVRNISILMGNSTIVAEYEYGFFIYVTEDQMDDWPEDLETVAQLVRNAGYTWIRFDSAGDMLENLPTYDW